jgi:toxin ParE1/3/4
MAVVTRTDQAELDLGDIFAYIAGNNVHAAKGVLRSIDQKCDLLAVNPNLGRERSDLLENIRSFPYGNYIIFYRPTSDGILIVRVLHSARDVSDRMF